MEEMIKNNFNITEEKSIKNTKLILRNVKINTESYESKLLSEDSIDKIIKFQIVYEGEEKALLFDVSGTQSLDEYLISNKLNKEDICNIIIAIDEILTSLENYLISENSVSLDPRLIRVKKDDYEELNLSFIVIPNLNLDFSYELSKFLIRILRFVDVSDKDALNLAYSLFVRSSKDNYVINDLMELIDSVKTPRIKDLSKMNYDDLKEYDENMAFDLAESTIDENYLDYGNPEDIDEEEVFKDISIDDETKDLLGESLLSDFDKEDKKIIKFSKQKNKKMKKKFFNAHIKLDFACYVLVPLFLVAIPIMYFFINGKDAFIKNITIIFAYEFFVFVLLVIGRIMNYRMKRV